VGAKVIFNKYFLHSLLLLAIYALGSPKIYAGTSELSYEKFYRLNKPLYRSESGDWLGGTYQTLPPDRKFDYFLMGDLRYYFQDNNSLNYSVQEAYLKFQVDDFSITAGRKILDWNTNEKYWGLGYLNGLQAFTLLSTKEEGVTGVTINKKLGNFEIEVLGSYLFIPSLNPSINFKNGDVQSRSEWVRLPPKKTVLSGVTVPLYYKIDKYNVSDIIFNKSIGANISYKWRNGGLAAFAIYKPENHLRINASAYYDNLNTNKVIVTASPTINHHAYSGIQLYQAFGDIKARGGLSYVDPNAKLGKDFLFDISNARKTFTSDYFNINPRYDKEAYAHISLNFERPKQYILTLNYIHLLSHNIRGSDDFFSDTVKWKSTFGGGFVYYVTDTFNIGMDLKYDVIRKDNILKGEVKYNFVPQGIIALGLEVLKAPDINSYWSYYRASDTLYSTIGFFF
jgi:hypothetical protein